MYIFGTPSVLHNQSVYKENEFILHYCTFIRTCLIWQPYNIDTASIRPLCFSIGRTTTTYKVQQQIRKNRLHTLQQQWHQPWRLDQHYLSSHPLSWHGRMIAIPFLPAPHVSFACLLFELPGIPFSVVFVFLVDDLLALGRGQDIVLCVTFQSAVQLVHSMIRWELINRL